MREESTLNTGFGSWLAHGDFPWTWTQDRVEREDWRVGSGEWTGLRVRELGGGGGVAKQGETLSLPDHLTHTWS